MKITIIMMLGAVLFAPLAVKAEACTYDEARIALENGNMQRANVLMQMAATDGDKRARRYLQAQNIEFLSEMKERQIAQINKSLISSP